MIASWKAIYVTLVAIVALVGSLIVSFEKTPPAEVSFGAIPGNEVQGNEFIIGGVKHYAYHQVMVATSSNACSIKTPVATTTFESANIGTRMSTHDVVSSTITLVGIALGTNTWATTTVLNTQAVVAGQNAETAASTTDITGAANHLKRNLLPPNTYINFFTVGTSTTNIGLAGVCNASLIGVE